jgi:hypothetical protein
LLVSRTIALAVSTVSAYLKIKTMISNKKKHSEKSKLSDKFQQPWDLAGTNGHQFVKNIQQ